MTANVRTDPRRVTRVARVTSLSHVASPARQSAVALPHVAWECRQAVCHASPYGVWNRPMATL